MPHVENQTDILTAALECNRDMVYRTFEREPLLLGKKNGNQLRTLADDMIANTVDELPGGWK